MMAIHGSPECERNRENAIDTLTMVATDPATGVQRPARSNIPAATPMICRMTAKGEDSSTPMIPKWISANPVRSRRSRRPIPGQPSAKVENSRCNPHPFQRRRLGKEAEGLKLGVRYPPFRGLRAR